MEILSGKGKEMLVKEKKEKFMRLTQKFGKVKMDFGHEKLLF